MPMIKNILISPDPTYRPPPKLTRVPTWEHPENIDISPEINNDFKENSLFQEGVISETYQKTNKSFFQEPQELECLVNTGNLLQKILTKQADIDKLLKIIKRKVLRDTHFPVTIKNIGRIPDQSMFQGYLSVSSAK